MNIIIKLKGGIIFQIFKVIDRWNESCRVIFLQAMDVLEINMQNAFSR